MSAHALFRVALWLLAALRSAHSAAPQHASAAARLIRTEAAQQPLLAPDHHSAPPRVEWRVDAGGAAEAPPPAAPGRERLPHEQSGSLGGGAAPASLQAQVRGRSRLLECGEFTPAKDIGEKEDCPKECPFWAESASDDLPCNFKCVTETECGMYGQDLASNFSVADKAGGYCRHCHVFACELCAVHEDRCQECSKGYFLRGGQCVSNIVHLRYAAMITLIGLLVYFIAWYIDLRCRPVVNEEGLQHGLRYRSRSKLRQSTEEARPDWVKEWAKRKGLGRLVGAKQAASASPAAAPAAAGEPPVPPEGEEGSRPDIRPLWPLVTNMLTEPAGGPGITLLFRFQLYWIVWSLFALSLWAIMAGMYSEELFEIGAMDMSTPRDLCRAITKGYDLQQQAMQLKVAYCSLLYAASIISSVVFGILQLRRYQQLDDKTTMKDFAALLKGLPRAPGTEPVEMDVAQAVQAATGQRVVGVSVAWDITETHCAVRDCLEEDLAAREANPEEAAALAAARASHSEPEGSAAAQDEPAPTEEEAAEAQRRALDPYEGHPWRARFFGCMDRLMLWIWEVPEETKELDVQKLVDDMESTDYAFVVFESESARDLAFAAMPPGGFDYKDCKVRMKIVEAEPNTVRWNDMGVRRVEVPFRMLKGILTIVFFLLLWGTLFYLPYVAYLQSIDYDATIQAPDEFMSTLLMIIVVAGNCLMYVVCSIVAEKVGFHYEESKESCYMVFYCLSVLLNVALDMCVAGVTSYKAMVAAKAPTFGGRPLGALNSVQDIFESYPIQKSLGTQLYAYSFPSTFLIPFLAEPFAIIFLPYHFMCLLVRGNPWIKGWRAEKALKILVPMDSGRYSDVLVNVMLACLILFVPPGFAMPILVGLFFSHIYIYVYDTYRVLRCVPSFCFASNTIDTFGLILSTVPSGILLSVTLFLANCMPGGAGGYCVKGGAFIYMEIQGFVASCVFQSILLLCVVPRFGLKNHKKSEDSYVEAAKRTGATWFSVNPAYCMRSKYFYKHSPPCDLFVPGKEHLLHCNPAIGQHFKGEPAEAEDY